MDLPSAAEGPSTAPAPTAAPAAAAASPSTSDRGAAGPGPGTLNVPQNSHSQSQNQQNTQNLSPQNSASALVPQNLPRPPCNQARIFPEWPEPSGAVVRRAYSPASSEPSPINSPNTGAPLYNWQATMKTVQERFAFLFNNEILADVHFLVGRDEARQRIPAHKFILSCGSAVFDALFNGSLSTQADEVEIPDVEPVAFLALLKFLYSDGKDIDSDSVMTTLYTAKKYAVPALETHCVEFLEENLRSDNAFMLLTQARLFDEPLLASMCLDCIDKNTAEALAADGFTDIDYDTLSLVLERDTLAICEGKLFQAVVRWAEAQCRRQNLSPTPENQRKVLGRSLYLIRFPLMTMEQFAVGAVQSGILTDNEAVQMFLYFIVNPKPSVGFVDTPRCCGNETTVCRFQHIESRWGYSGTSDRVRILVDRRIFIVGFGLYGATVGPAEYEVLLQLIHTATGKLCGSTATGFTCDGSNYTFRVPFKDPVEIQPNTSYIAAATLKGPDSYYGTKGMRKVAIEVPGSGKVTFQFSYAAGNNNGTSVEDGQIPEIIFHL